jgi:hypothetical protein
MGTRGVPAWLTHQGDRLRHNTSPLASCRTLRCTPRRNRPATLRSLPRLTRTRSAGCPPQQQAGRSRGGSSTKSRGTRRGRRSHRGHRPAARPGTRGLGGPAGGAWRERAFNAEDALKTANAEILTQRARIGELLGQIRDLQAEWTEAAIQQNTTENTTLKQRVRRLAADNRTLEVRLTAARSDLRFQDRRVADWRPIRPHRLDHETPLRPSLRPGVGVRVG